ncbi:MAG TPA: TIGR01777 family oxidoreductase [Acidimicrobiales bacterium]|nr:TIGR01777 family oxidoreductase [Acidimicrobiales bacterium]
MRVIVTGSTGLIGRSLTGALRARGDEVVGLVRRAPQGAGEARWDPAAGQLDPALLEGADGVVHLAGAGIGDRRWTAGRRREIVASRVDSTALVARTLARLERPPEVLVSASAVGWYGDRGDEELTEESGAGTGFLAEVCQAWEEATGEAAAAGRRVVRLRSGVVLSASGGALRRQLPLFRLGLGGRLGDGRQWLSWIAVDDEVGIILHALEDRSLAGAVNATAPAPVTNREFTAALGAVLHRPTVAAVPRAALRLALGPELAAEMVLASQRVLPSRVVAAGYRFRHATVDAALRAVLRGG